MRSICLEPTCSGNDVKLSSLFTLKLLVSTDLAYDYFFLRNKKMQMAHVLTRKLLCLVPVFSLDSTLLFICAFMALSFIDFAKVYG